MGTKNTPGQFDCYSKAEPDEPLFTLLARDPIAPLLVALWADVNRRLGGCEEKSKEAEEVARAMRRWSIRRMVR